MTEERFWFLASLKLSGEAQPSDIEELEQYLSEHPERQWQLSIFESAWKPGMAAADRRESAFNKHMQRLSNHFADTGLQYDSPSTPDQEITEPRRKRSVIRIVAWTTAVAASLITAWFLAGQPFIGAGKKEALAQNTVSTKRGSKSKVQLPDGTQVWLNADSRITYNENFQGKFREVNLSGEAFFDVVKNEDRPFIIHTNYVDVRVLGTAFNVRSYADEANTETSLIRGSVEITLRNHPERKFTLKPNDKLIVNNEQAGAQPETKNGKLQRPANNEIVLEWRKVNYREKSDTIATEVLWTKNKLAFDKEPLERIALMIERWYDVKVTITDDAMKSTEFSLTIDNESLKQVMDALREAGGGKLRYAINKKEVTIRP